MALGATSFSTSTFPPEIRQNGQPNDDEPACYVHNADAIPTAVSKIHDSNDMEEISPFATG